MQTIHPFGTSFRVGVCADLTARLGLRDRRGWRACGECRLAFGAALVVLRGLATSGGGPTS